MLNSVHYNEMKQAIKEIKVGEVFFVVCLISELKSVPGYWPMCIFYCFVAATGIT